MSVTSRSDEKNTAKRPSWIKLAQAATAAIGGTDHLARGSYKTKAERERERERERRAEVGFKLLTREIEIDLPRIYRIVSVQLKAFDKTSRLSSYMQVSRTCGKLSRERIPAT